jgi:hypothetical protein
MEDRRERSQTAVLPTLFDPLGSPRPGAGVKRGRGAGGRAVDDAWADAPRQREDASVPPDDVEGYVIAARSTTRRTFSRAGAEVLTFRVPAAAASSPSRMLAVAGEREHQLIIRSVRELAGAPIESRAARSASIGTACWSSGAHRSGRCDSAGRRSGAGSGPGGARADGRHASGPAGLGEGETRRMRSCGRAVHSTAGLVQGPELEVSAAVVGRPRLDRPDRARSELEHGFALGRSLGPGVGRLSTLLHAQRFGDL